MFQTCWWCLLTAFQEVSSCSASLCFKPADNNCPWLLRKWVAAMPCHALPSNISALCCTGGVLLLYFPALQTCWWTLFLPLSWWVAECLVTFLVSWSSWSPYISDCEWLLGLMCFKLVDTCSWHFREWAGFIPFCIPNLLMHPVHGLQEVSGFYASVHCKSADEACLDFADCE